MYIKHIKIQNTQNYTLNNKIHLTLINYEFK